MPDLTVNTFIRYQTDVGIDWNRHEWAALHAKKIIKNEPLSARSHFNWQLRSGVDCRIDQDRRSTFETDICARFADHILNNWGTNIIIVPVPNGDGVINSRSSFRTLDLVQRIATASRGQLQFGDALRWKEPAGKSHKNERARKVDSHIANLAVNPSDPRSVVLFDDVVTSGSQMAAAKIKLEEQGHVVHSCYAIFDVLDPGARGAAPCWTEIRRHPMHIADFFASDDS
jgi:hypothetical protein